MSVVGMGEPGPGVAVGGGSGGKCGSTGWGPGMGPWGEAQGWGPSMGGSGGGAQGQVQERGPWVSPGVGPRGVWEWGQGRAWDPGSIGRGTEADPGADSGRIPWAKGL